MQCVAGAMTAGVAVTGSRAWLFARAGAWLTPGRKRALTGVLLAGGILAAGIVAPTP